MALVNPNIALAGTPMQVPNFLAMQQTAADTQNTLANTDIMQEEAARASEAATYNTALSRSKDALRFVNTPEDYLAWTQASFKDPVLGSILQKMGMDPNKALASAREQLQQPGGLQSAIGRSASSIDQLAQSMTEQGGQARAQAQAQAETARANARKAQQNAAVQAILTGQGGAPAPALAPAPVATAQPVPPPVDTMQYAPGRPGAVNQLYAQVGAQPTPALNALTQTPSMGSAAPAGADPRMAQLTALRNAQMGGNTEAGRVADILEAQIEFNRKQSPTQDPTKRFLNLGEQGVFDVVDEQMVEGTARRPKTGTPLSVVQPDGSVVYVAPEEALGKTPGSQAPTVGERTAARKANVAKKKVDEITTTIAEKYTELNKLGGVPSTSQGPMANIQAYSAAVVPQVGRALGTKEQSLRDSIGQIRPLLMQAIKDATGMSAQQMNSNVELQLYLNSATSPDITLEANIAALNNLSNLYGLGTTFEFDEKGNLKTSKQNADVFSEADRIIGAQ
jgi:hypothetical protein